MGVILRLDVAAITFDESDIDRVGVVTRTWGEPGARSGTGRVWPIRVHPTPELRLKDWRKGEALPAGATTVVIGHGGELDYFELAPGYYEADSATAARGVARSVVFQVRANYSAELVSATARSGDGKELVIARLSGWTLDRLRRERAAFGEELAARARAEGLAELVGSPGQVDWANQIRPTKIRHAREYLAEKGAELARLRPGEADHAKLAEAVGWLRATLEYLRLIDDAGWWLSHKEVRGVDLLKYLARAGRDGQFQLANDEGRGASA